MTDVADFRVAATGGRNACQRARRPAGWLDRDAHRRGRWPSSACLSSRRPPRRHDGPDDSLLGPAAVGPAQAEAHIMRRGRRSTVLRVEVHDVNTHKLAAVATIGFAVFDLRGRS